GAILGFRTEPLPPPPPETKAYREAMEKLSAGDLTTAVRGLLEIHAAHADSEEGYFAEEQLTRIRRLWPEEAAKAGLTTEAWAAVQSRAQARRAGVKPPAGATPVIALLLLIAAWCFLVA